jgi:hypothetical protein
MYPSRTVNATTCGLEDATVVQSTWEVLTS